MSEIPPNVQPPTPDEIRKAAEKHYMDLSDAEVGDFVTAIEESLGGYERLDELAEPRPTVEYTDATRDTNRTRRRTHSTPSSGSVTSTGPIRGRSLGTRSG